MKFYIRYLGMRVETLDLKPGSYLIGRDPHCDIHLTQSFISRKHARLFFNNDEWWVTFFDREQVESTAHKVIATSAIDLGFDLDLVSEDYLSDEETIFDEPQHVVRERRSIIRRTVVGVFLIVLSVVIWLISTPLLDKAHLNKDPNLIFKEVSPMVVELVAHRSAKAIEEYKSLGGFTQEDLKKSDGFCTGFIVARDVVVTASHCVLGQNLTDLSVDFSVKTSDQILHQPSRILGLDLKKDFLFLEVPGLQNYDHLKLALKSQMGERVFTVGNVHGEGIAIREGILSSKTIDPSHPDTEFIRYSAPASPGNSGGPLVNVKGEVVALVFGVTSAENYNLGTPAAYLAEGIERYVEDREEKHFDFVLNDFADINIRTLLSQLSYPAQTALDERPDLFEEYKKLKLNLSLPVSFQNFDRYLLDELNVKLSQIFKSTEKKLLDQGLVNGSWFSYLSQNIPFILPVHFEKPFDQFIPGDTDFRARYIAVLDGPTQSDFDRLLQKKRKSGSLDFESFRYYLEIFLNERGEWVYLNDSYGLKRRLGQYLNGQPFFTFVAKKKDEEVFIVADPNELLQKFLGQKGIIAAPSSELIRPNSMREFVLKYTDKKFDTSVAQDGLGRSWVQYSTSYFESFDFTSFCTQAPQGQWCVSRLFDYESQAQLDIMKKNYLQYWLPSYLLAPHFWDVQNLISYLQPDRIEPQLQDFIVKLKKNNFEVELKSTGISFETSTLRPVAVRLSPALGWQNEKRSWLGQSFDLLVIKGKEWSVCGGGFEPDDQNQSNFIAMQRRRELFRNKIKKPTKTKIWLSEDFQLGSGQIVNLYGYCAPLKKEKGFYAVDWEEIKPHVFKVKSNQ